MNNSAVAFRLPEPQLTSDSAVAYLLRKVPYAKVGIVEDRRDHGYDEPVIDIEFTLDGHRECMSVWIEDGQLYGEF